jgi:peptidoglycan/LPS O-acetylase OafA/YrhL
MLVINASRKVIDNPFFVLAVGLPITIAIATAVYNYIESPLLRYKSWLEPKKTPDTTPKPAESPRPTADVPAPAASVNLMRFSKRLNLMP